MDKDNNNPTNLEGMINDLPEVKTEILTQASSTELPKTASNDLPQIKSAFDEMSATTQVVENVNKPESLENAPVIPKPKEEKVSVPQSDDYNLNAQTIGTVQPDKQKSPIAMLVLFGFLVSFMVFMPEVLNFVNKTFGTNLETHTGVNIPDVVDQETETQKVTMFDFNDDTVITLDKISFQSFVKSIEDEDYKLSFTIKNSGTQLYDFKKKLYFEFYNESSTFIGRAYLENVKEITGGITNNYKVTINQQIYDSAKKIELVQRTDDDYPSVELVSNQLTCTNNKYNLVYTFDSNQRLTYIKDMYTYIKPDDVVAYSTDLISYKSKIDNLDRKDGVTAVLAENETGFVTTIAIDYAQANYNELSSDTNYYKKETYARVIKFEMSAKGYTCR